MKNTESLTIRALEYDLLYNENNTARDRDNIIEFLHILNYGKDNTKEEKKVFELG